MLNSRKVEDLIPYMQAKCNAHKKACLEHGVDLLITSTRRDAEYQLWLFNNTSSTQMKDLGPHGFGIAYDCVPQITWNGKKIAIYDEDDLPKGWTGLSPKKMWDIVGSEGKKLGLEWANDWKSFPEKCHFQCVEGLKSADLRAGKRPSFYNWKPTEVKESMVVKEVEKTKQEVKTTLFVDGKLINIDIVEIKNSNYVPLRALFEALGYKVTWDDIKKQIRISK